MPVSIGPYFVERELGSGGMGTVYLGRHKETDHFVAVKLLPASMAREAGFVARFEREIEAMRQLKSPHIVELYDSGEQDGASYYTMEFVDGETLADRLTREKRIPWQEAIEIAAQTCVALKAAHNAGIVHRDLKPSNLLIDPEGTVKLADFGVAQVFATGKLTVTGGVLGTAEYMSPEQAQGQRATRQSDLYSLGAMMYVMLTGRPPFTGKTPLEIIQKHRFSQFDSVRRLVPEVPHWLDEVVCKCLSKKPEDRYPDAYVLKLRLEEIPRKVALQQSDDSEAGGTEETIAENAVVDAQPQQVGGTLVRDLFRAQMEAERRGSGLQRLLDNVWVLIGLLIGLVLLVYGLNLLNTPSEQELFARGEQLMDLPPGPAWETARRDYFEKLLTIDEARWQEQVQPYLEQIEVYDLRKRIQGRTLNKEELPASEPESILRQAIHLRQLGQHTQARQKLLALQHLLDGNEEFETFRRLTEQLIEEWSIEKPTTDLEYVEQALQRADVLFEKGEIDRALGIWFGIVQLYDTHPDAVAYVEQARRRYLQETGVELIFPNSITGPVHSP